MAFSCAFVPWSPAKQMVKEGSQADNLFELAKRLNTVVEAHGGCSAATRDTAHRLACNTSRVFNPKVAVIAARHLGCHMRHVMHFHVSSFCTRCPLHTNPATYDTAHQFGLPELQRLAWN